MKLTTENYTIVDDHHGYSLIVKVPSESEKSKTGFTEKKTFHANLHQVAKKMISYEVMHSDAKDVFALAEAIDRAADKLASCLVAEVPE